MNYPLAPPSNHSDPESLLEVFLNYVAGKGIDLYPAQEEAILELFSGKNVILNTPTGSGKSLVAAAMHFLSIATGRRSVYTCPIKALVNEKFLSLCRDFGPDNVGMMTGDATVNREAPILCCTAEILANIALRDGANAAVNDVIMDEFHYYSDPDRGGAWQVPLLTMSQSRFLLMSATLGDTRFFQQKIEALTGAECVTVAGTDRPVPLEFSYLEISLTETLEKLQAAKNFPAYIVHFSQRAASETAQNLMSVSLCSKEEKQRITTELQGVTFNSPFGKDIKRFLRSGIGLHHAGLLPKYRVLIEKLAQQGLLKVICGTDTLGVGVNVPIRTVLFTQLCKYDGVKTATLKVRDFHQISGRAGRKGFDDQGYVISLAPEHVIENLRLEAKAANDPKKKKKLVKRKPPQHGFVHWDAQTFARLEAADPEPLQSSLKVSHSMLLNVLGRDGDGCRAMRDLIDNCHNSKQQKAAMRREAFQLFRALVERNIIEVLPVGGTQKLRLNVELQDDFSLNQTLSLYCLDTLGLLDTTAADYPLKLLSLVEAILENPEIILRKQLDKVKGEAVAEMKAAGIEYDERMEKLESLEYPKPEREFIYTTFNRFAKDHPWVGEENIKPKSIAREMFERYSSFGDYIKSYGLMRAEGVLLRHLNSVYRILRSMVPPAFKTDPVDEVITYLEQLVRITDSSLIDEWELMRHPDAVPADVSTPEVAATPVDITRDKEGFTRLVRNEIFAFLRTLANGEYQQLGEDYDLAELFPDSQGGHLEWETMMDRYYQQHEWIRLDPAARAKGHTHCQESDDHNIWTITQTVVDAEETNDFFWTFRVSLTEAREQGAVKLMPLQFHCADDPC